MKNKSILIGSFSAIIATQLLWSPIEAVSAGVDWNRWRGPELNGISKETGWNANWSAAGPKRLWQAEVGVGFSSFSVANGKVFTMGHSNNKDTVYCLEAATGNELWRFSYDHPLDDKYYEGGTSSTPTVDGKFLYTLSKRGHLFCFDIATGKIVWSHNVIEDFGIEKPEWGLASSPLVMDDLLIINAGSAGMAFKKATGASVWKSGKGAAGYATPIPFANGGKKVLAIFGANAVNVVEPENGKLAWSFPWKTSYDVNAADPIIAGTEMFISSSYGKGCALIDFAGGQPKTIYQNKTMRNHFNSCVLIDGYLYGTTGEAGQSCYLICMDWKTGSIKWQERSVGLGSLMAADGKLIVLSDKGELMIVKPQPSGFEAISRTQVLKGKCWTVPVLSQGRIYCRNAAGSVVCLDVTLK